MKGLISAAFIAMLIGCGGGGTAVEDLPDSPDILKEEAKEEAGDEIFETVEAETSDIEISEEYKQETVEAEIPHECEKDEDCAGVITDLKQCEVGKCESYKCVKKNAPENSECDDGNPCTFGDRCSGGFCIEGQNYCECEEDKDCKQYEDGDLCNGTLYCKKEAAPYKCSLKPGSIVTCEYPQKLECLEYKCAPLLGTCQFTPIDEGDECDDKNPCSTQSFCISGVCKGQNDVVCDDGDKCTSDACVFGVGCVFAGNVQACDDENPCTEDSCDSEKGCLHKTVSDFDCKPLIVINDPARGTTLDGDAALTISGSASAKAGNIQKVLVNGADTAPDENGDFSAQAVSQTGMNVIVAEAQDQYGGYSLLKQAYYFSKDWHPFNDVPSSDSWVENGIRIVLKKELFDDDDSGDLDDYASYLGVFLTPESINSMLVNPAAAGVFNGCSYETSIYDIAYSPADVDIKPQTGGISIDIALADFSASVVSSATGENCPAIYGLLSADALTVNLSAGIALSAEGALEVTAGNPSVGVSGLKINNEDGSLFAPFVIEAFQKAISKDLGTVLSSNLAGALEHLAIDSSYQVPSALENGQAAEVNVKTKLKGIEFSDADAELTLSALINAPDASGYESKGSIGMTECIQQPAAGIQSPGSVHAFIHDDLLNQLLFAMHRGGVLKGKFWDIGDLQQYGITDPAVEVDFLLPPIVNSCKTDEKYFLQAGDVFVQAAFDLFGYPVEFLLFASVEVSGILSIGTSETAYELSFDPEAVEAIHADVMAISGIENADEAYYTELLEEEILPAIFSEFLNGSIFSFSYPLIDLEEILYGFQGGGVVKVHQPERIKGFTVLPMSL